MTSTIVNFPKAQKPRRETKKDLAERILPKILGVLGNSELQVVGGEFPKTPKSSLALQEIGGFRFHAAFHGPQFDNMVMIHVQQDENEIMDAWIYGVPLYSNNGMVFENHVWLRRFDFKGRADWIPRIAAMSDAEVSHKEFHRWLTDAWYRRA